MAAWQISPPYPSSHTHWYPVLDGRHLPPFLHVPSHQGLDGLDLDGVGLDGVGSVGWTEQKRGVRTLRLVEFLDFGFTS